MPSLSFCFDQFAKEMLLAPSKADTLIDLQAEFNALSIMADEKQSAKQQKTDIDLDWGLDKYLTWYN